MEKSKAKFLAIDDNRDNLITLKALIREAFPDSITLTATNGAAGIELAQSEAPDVILLDVVMPVMDGFEVCRKLKSIPQTHDIPVVFLTALKGDKESRLRALEVGAEAFLAKPIDETELTAQLKAMLKIKIASDLKSTEKERLAQLVTEQTRAIEQTQIATLNLLEDLSSENEARKQKEIALSESEEKFKYVFEAANVGKSITSIEGELNVNQAFCDILGYTRDEMTHMTWQKLTPVGEYGITEKHVAPLLSGEKNATRFVKRYIHKNGSDIWADVSIAMRRDNEGRPLHYITTIVDITERVLAEQQLILQSTALNSAANAIVITDRTGAIEWLNPAYTQLTGYSIDEAIGQNPRILKSGLQDPAYYKNLWDTILSGNVWHGELVNRRKDGSLYTEDETITPLIGANGQIEHFIGIKVDISARKQQEAEILKNNRDINLLYEAGKQLSQSLDIQSIYLAFYNLIQSTMPCNTFYIAGYDPHSQLIRAKYAVMDGQPVSVSEFPAIPLEPEGCGIQSPVIRSGQSRIVNDYAEALKKTKTNYYMDDAGKNVEEELVPGDEPVTQSALIVPILMNNQVTGVVQVQSYQKNAFTAENLKIAEALVSQIAVAANNAELYQQSLAEIESRIQAELSLRMHAQRQEKLAALGRELGATLDLASIYQTAERHLNTMIDCPNFSITHFDARQMLMICAYLVSDGEVMDPSLIPPLKYDSHNISGGRAKAIASKKPVLVQNMASRRISSGGMLIGSDREPETAIYVPILVADEVIGLLELQSYQEAAYSDADGEWLSVVANQIGLAIQNARLLAETLKRVAELQVTHDIDLTITTEPGDIYHKILERITTQPYVDAAAILIFDAQEKLLNYAAAHGFTSPAITTTRIKLGQGLAGIAAMEKRPVEMLKPAENMPDYFHDRLWEDDNFAAYLALPLMFHGELKGVLEIFSRQAIPPDLEWMSFMGSLAQQVAIAVDNSQLFSGLQTANTELLQAYDATIAGWSQAMDLRDRETEGHTERVMALTMQIARALGISEEKLVHVRRGAMLHDIGKLGVPDQILHKPGPLTDEEWVIMKNHPGLAYEMIASIDYLRPALAIPYCHHEKWDGTGYPRGLKGDEIPLEARIFALADVYDALTTDRPYRSAWSQEKTLAYIEDLSGKQFDPEITTAFSALLRKLIS